LSRSHNIFEVSSKAASIGAPCRDRKRSRHFRFLTVDEQKLAAAASPLHAAECDKAKRKSLDAHKLIAERFWMKHPHASPSSASS
jgi:hypothetical protein